MPAIEIDTLMFTFDTNWKCQKTDEWAFYRRHFSKIMSGIKSVDCIAIDTAAVAWLIESKDYRLFSRTKPSEISEEVAKKVFDTLAMLLPAKNNASKQEESEFAREVCGCNKLRVVLHLEQPAKHSKLFPRAIDPADVMQKMRQRLRSIDAHPIVSEIGNMRGLSWAVA
ncbi:MAG: hypothetical protein WAZ48_16485 [Lysobacteraceae bacterium]